MTTYVEYKFCERGFDSELRHGSPTGADAKHGISSVLLADAATDDTDIKIAGETMTSAGYFLCPEHRDELDSYLDNN